MSLFVFCAVLFSALFQAGWNFVTKNSKANKIALLAVGWFFFGLLLLPIALWLHPPSIWKPEWILYLIGTGVIHGFYVCLLGWGYAIGDISVVYPIARGLGIAGTTVLAVALGFHGLSTAGALGILSIIAGTFFIGLKEAPKARTRKAFLVAILIAIVVSLYSIIDSQGVKTVPLFLFLVMMNLVAPIMAAPFLLWKLRPEIKQVLKFHKREAGFVSVAGSIAYAIILWAYQQSPTAYVAALREFSVVIAASLGIFLLKEPVYKRKILGIMCIVLGVLFLKLA